MPTGIEPWGEVVQCQHTGFLRQIRHSEIGPVDYVRAQTPRLAPESPKPPAALGRRARAAAALQVGGSVERHLERLVAGQNKFIIRETSGKRPAQLGRVASQAAAR